MAPVPLRAIPFNTPFNFKLNNSTPYLADDVYLVYPTQALSAQNYIAWPF